MDEGNISESSNRWDNLLIELQPQQLIQIAFLGAIVGIASWILTMLIRQVIIVPLFCGDPSNAVCVGATDIAGTFATILAGVVGLMGLVRIGVFRPLLIVIVLVLCLWGLSRWVGGMPWYTALAWSVILYGLLYTLLLTESQL